MRVLLFAHLKNVVGSSEVTLATTEPLTVEQFWQQLLVQHPQLATCRTSVRLACNLEFAGRESVFQPGDEVALIPPVSGG